MKDRMELSQIYAGLLLNRTNRADRDVPFGMWDGDPPGFCGVLELRMTAFLADFDPAVGLQP